MIGIIKAVQSAAHMPGRTQARTARLSDARALLSGARSRTRTRTARPRERRRASTRITKARYGHGVVVAVHAMPGRGVLSQAVS
eukprot:IDg9433t1